MPYRTIPDTHSVLIQANSLAFQVSQRRKSSVKPRFPGGGNESWQNVDLARNQVKQISEDRCMGTNPLQRNVWEVSCLTF